MAATAGEVAELKELFASPSRGLGSPPRESALPLTRIAKFGVADENRRLAEQGRMEKEARLRQREQEAAERLAKAHASKAAAQLTNERARQHKELTKEMNHSLVQAIRETEAEWQEERQMAFSNFRNEARARVLIANALDARLDAQEAAVDAEERRLATAGRVELMRQVEEVRQTNLLEKRENASNVRESTTKAVAEAQDAAATAKKLAAESKRTDSKNWARSKMTNKEEQKLRASIGRNAVRTARTHARTARALRLAHARSEADTCCRVAGCSLRRPASPPCRATSATSAPLASVPVSALPLRSLLTPHLSASVHLSPFPVGQAEATRQGLHNSKEQMINERKALVMRDKKERMIDYTVAQYAPLPPMPRERPHPPTGHPATPQSPPRCNRRPLRASHPPKLTRPIPPALLFGLPRVVAGTRRSSWRPTARRSRSVTARSSRTPPSRIPGRQCRCAGGTVEEAAGGWSQRPGRVPRAQSAP